jgi:hypothetical protein
VSQALAKETVELFYENLDHAMALLLLLGRLADVVSTRLASPKLLLEANPIARRLGWPFAWVTLLVCLIAYIDPWGPAAAVPLILASFWVAASNLARGWAMRALGEEAFFAYGLDLAAKARPGYVVASLLAAGVLQATPGVLLLVFYPKDTDWAYYFAMGILIYAGVVSSHSITAFRRMRRLALAEPRTAP